MSLTILDDPTMEEQAVMLEAAKTTDDADCLSWHKFCNAECCTQWSIPDEGQDLSLQKIRIYGSSFPDLIRYYELHGCKYRMPWLYIPTKNARRHNGRIFFLDRCKALTVDNKCLLHGRPGKPKVCKEFNMENVRTGNRYGGSVTTSRCLYKYKAELEGIHHGKENGK